MGWSNKCVEKQRDYIEKWQYICYWVTFEGKENKLPLFFFFQLSLCLEVETEEMGTDSATYGVNL